MDTGERSVRAPLRPSSIHRQSIQPVHAPFDGFPLLGARMENRRRPRRAMGVSGGKVLRKERLKLIPWDEVRPVI
jgi:hypothetical protein